MRNHLTLCINEEFGEVPGNLLELVLVFALHVQSVTSKELVSVMSIFAVNQDFLEHWESDSILLGESIDLLRSTRLLTSKLVAWECKNLKTLIGELCINLNHLFVVLISKTSLGGNVDKKYSLFIFAM